MRREKEKISLSDSFTYGRLIRFTIPSVVMMLFASVYGVVDGFFISNFVGETAFSAINLIMPFLMLFSAVGFMIGTGGAALVSKILGTGEHEHAVKAFSSLVYITVGLGILFVIIGEITLRPVAAALGAEGKLLEFSVRYGRIFLTTMPAFMLQYSLQNFLVTAEKPKLGLRFMIMAGVANMILDALFIAVFRWNVEGAAAATCIGQCIGGIGPIIYFSRENSSLLRLVKPEFNMKDILKAFGNGAAEFLSNVSLSVVNIAYNYQLLKTLGEYGVSAYGIIMYLGFVFVSIYLGYSMGVAPVVGFHYGAGDRDELRNILKRSAVLIAVTAIVLTAAAEAGAGFLAGIFAGYDEVFFELSKKALRLYSLSYLLAGFNIFSSAFFAALNNGPISALMSFSRVLVFQMACVFVIPMIVGIDGIWLSMLVAEICALILNSALLIGNAENYGYLKINSIRSGK